VTDPRKKHAEHDTNRSTAPFVPAMRLSGEDRLELQDPDYDPGGPDYPEHWLPGLPGRPVSWIVIAELPGLRPDHPSILDKFLGNGPTRSYDPEPDLEAEP
jgi:hypothetical protein